MLEVALTNSLGEVTPTQAGQLLGMSRPQVRKLMESGELDFRKVGTRHRVTVASIRTFLAAERVRHLHRLPDTLAELRQEAAKARDEASRAEARIGVPWDRGEELAGLRHLQKERDEALTATIEGAVPEPEPVAVLGGKPSAEAAQAVPVDFREQTVPTAEPNSPVERMTSRLDAIQQRTATQPSGLGL